MHVEVPFQMGLQALRRCSWAPLGHTRSKDYSACQLAIDGSIMPSLLLFMVKQGEDTN